MTSVVIVDDQEIIAGRDRPPARHPEGIEVVGEAANGGAADAADGTARRRPHGHPDARIDGIAATATSCTSSAVVLVLTTYDPDGLVYRALRAGAAASSSRRTAPHAWPRASELVAAGEALLAPSVTRRLSSSTYVGWHRGGDAGGSPALTARERRRAPVGGRAGGPTRIAADSAVADRPSRPTSPGSWPSSACADPGPGRGAGIRVRAGQGRGGDSAPRR